VTHFDFGEFWTLQAERPLSQLPRNGADSTGRCNTTWYKSYFLKGGVHEPRETMEAIFGPEGRYVEPLEGWTVFK
jgi:hypothetical protein